MADSEKEKVEIQEDKPINPKVKRVKELAIRERAKAEVIKAGLKFPSRPSIPPQLEDGDKVQLPDDLTKVTDEELGQFLTVFTGLSAYASGVVAVADIDRTTSDNIATLAERFEIISLPRNLQKNDDLRYGSVHMIDYVFDLRQKAMQDEANFKMAQGVLESYEKAINAISREITRRGNTFKHGQYEDNIGNRGRR